MYLLPTKTLVTEALRSIFDGSYPEPDFRSVNVTVDFPMEQQNYPGIWIQFDDTEDLERAGVNHVEYIIDDLGIQREITRWRFGGTLSFTVAALSSQERDRLFDEVVRVLAFSTVDTTPAGRFKAIIEGNDLIGLNVNYDVLTPSGDAATPGTPWNTNEVIYERTISTAVIGEFVSDPGTNTLYPLSRIIVLGWPYADDEANQMAADAANSDGPYEPGEWI